MKLFKRRILYLIPILFILSMPATAEVTTDLPLDTGGLIDGLDVVPVSCNCTNIYRDGTEAPVLNCNNYFDECRDLETLQTCKENPHDPICSDSDGLFSCECDCSKPSEIVLDHRPEDGVYLTGIPNFWQHITDCQGIGISRTAPLGCGPLAITMLLYWYEQMGYEGLASQISPYTGETSHDEWQDIGEQVAAINPTYCASWGTALLPHEMAPAISTYISTYSSGHTATVGHYKVCDDCPANGSDEYQRNEGLEIILEELEAGRPVILGYNVKRSDSVSETIDGEVVSTGPLSNGTPGLGTIGHYSLITGYRQSSSGRDIIYVNTGQKKWIKDHPEVDDVPSHDIPIEWNPAGKWAHLYTVVISGDPDGPGWCSLDSSYYQETGEPDMNFSPTHDSDSPAFVDLSHAAKLSSTTEVVTPVSGSRCGIARTGEYVTVERNWTEIDRCRVPSDLPDMPGVGDEPPPPWDTGPLDPVQIP